MVGLHDQQPPPVDGPLPQIYKQTAGVALGVVPVLHIVGGVGLQVVGVVLQVVYNDLGQEAPLGGGGVFRGHEVVHLAGLGQHHKPVVVDVDGVIQHLGARLAQLL